MIKGLCGCDSGSQQNRSENAHAPDERRAATGIFTTPPEGTCLRQDCKTGRVSWNIYAREFAFTS